MKRYYYKAKDNKSYLSLKSPLSDDNYVEITEAEWNAAQPQPHTPTAAERAKAQKLSRIAFLKSELARTDYEAIKYAEGEMSAEDYEPYKVQRRAWRVEINELEAQL